jgi:cytochrome c-type biogenesis protein
MDSVSPFVAFTAGLLSLFSPCVLPMAPVYIASVAGAEVYRTGLSGRRLSVFFHSLSFVLGFAILFTILGAGAGAIGSAISSHLYLARQIAGGLLIAMGLFMLAAPHISWLNYEKRLTLGKSLPAGYTRSFLIGILFAVAWTPCASPVLAGILALAFNSESAWSGGALLAIYALGLGLPFLAIGMFLGYATRWLQSIRRYLRYIYIVSGLLLIAVGVLVFLNKLHWLSFT